MKKSDLPSAAQARLIARLWGQNKTVGIMVRDREGKEPYNEPTTAACVKRGWLGRSGAPYMLNDFEFIPHGVTYSGLLALGRFLRGERVSKVLP